MNLGFFLNPASSQGHFFLHVLYIESYPEEQKLPVSAVGIVPIGLSPETSHLIHSPIPTWHLFQDHQLSVISLTLSTKRHGRGRGLVAPCALSEHVGTLLTLPQAASQHARHMSPLKHLQGQSPPQCTYTLELMLGWARPNVPSMPLTFCRFPLLPKPQKSLVVLDAWGYHELINYLFTSAYMNNNNLALALVMQPLATQKAKELAKGLICLL